MDKVLLPIKDAVSRFPYFFILTVPNHFRYPVWGQEPSSLMHRHRRLLTQKGIFSPAYYITVGANNTLKCYIISAVIWLDYLQSSVFISINQTQMKLEPPKVEFTKEASQFQNTFWENHDLTEQPVITYIYLGYTYFFLFFKPWFCNGPETELKGKIGIRENISLVFYHIKTVGA